jgi:hypothetical protein
MVKTERDGVTDHYRARQEWMGSFGRPDEQSCRGRVSPRQDIRNRDEPGGGSQNLRIQRLRDIFRGGVAIGTAVALARASGNPERFTRSVPQPRCFP